MILSDCGCQLVWTRNFLNEISFNVPTLYIYSNNLGSLFWRSNPIQKTLLIFWPKTLVKLLLSISWIRNTPSPCHIPNSKTYLRHVWLQYNIKSPWLFGLICAQNSIGGLVHYNRLDSIKSLWLFCFVWVKIHSHIYLCPLPNYLLQTLKIYSDFM